MNSLNNSIFKGRGEETAREEKWTEEKRRGKKRREEERRRDPVVNMMTVFPSARHPSLRPLLICRSILTISPLLLLRLIPRLFCARRVSHHPPRKQTHAVTKACTHTHLNGQTHTRWVHDNAHTQTKRYRLWSCCVCVCGCMCVCV